MENEFTPGETIDVDTPLKKAAEPPKRNCTTCRWAEDPCSWCSGSICPWKLLGKKCMNGEVPEKHAIVIMDTSLKFPDEDTLCKGWEATDG